MTKRELTLMVVHAHPDDEVLSTGGVLLRCAQEGVRTVLVTCTNGELGDAPAGIKPDSPDHDESQVRAVRRLELLESCRILQVSRLEMLGYMDSGMEGWAQNGRPGSLTGAPLEEEVERLAGLIREERPQVLVTYDESGGYGHPDHIRTHQLAVAAAAATGIPEKVYHTAIPRSAVAAAARRMREMGVSLEALQDTVDPENPPFGVDDALVTTVVDVSEQVEDKLASLRAHSSQADNGFLLRFPPELVREFLSREYFVRAQDRTGADLPESDLFAGVR
ncbi:MAG: PIG-L family deacetylase [Candidatus Dormibacteraeota bacterium]|nr:PIG-L family deacetylase [Candidatus Dormibacteraeota bacterium]